MPQGQPDDCGPGDGAAGVTDTGKRGGHMPSEWKTLKVSTGTLEQELNHLDQAGYEIYAILSAGHALGDVFYTIVARKNR